MCDHVSSTLSQSSFRRLSQSTFELVLLPITFLQLCHNRLSEG
uniref:Uncharacterized protein n=1 Tax=Arundo donax TaxID=35708 RepID=A0A0A9FER0_ARUDO